MISFIFLSIGLILFEVIFRELFLFRDIAILFILMNVLYWFKRYKLVFICGFVSTLAIDLLLLNHLGETLFALFCPLLLLTFINNILHVESRTGQITFSLIGTVSSIFILDLLFEFIFWNENLDISLIMRRVVISSVFVLLVSSLLGEFLNKRDNKSKYL